ncbi:MAG: ABC transporter ATP-binding protein, partial [Clostridia bacterium]|nr:ABC transporter ATP-binding protein [Clostridia bacterium]
MTGGILVQAKNLHTSFPFDREKRVQAVDGVSLELRRGEIVGLVGESGSGKSVTSMSMLQLILPPGRVEGEVYVDGMEGNMLSYGPNSEEARSIRGGKIGMIFQEPMTSLNPILKVGFQIQENIMTHLKVDKDEAKRLAIEMMDKVGIANPEMRFNQYPAEFSGGMRQRIMIAMVLAARPDVLIADEATTALDVTTQAQILELIQSLSRTEHVSVVIVTHNLGLVARYADRIYVMYGGNIVESGDKYTLFESPQHPYTKGLLAAVPRLDDRKDRRLIPIEGLPPVAINLP